MVIVQDSREHTGKKDHIVSYFENCGLKVVRSKLYVGDYSLLHDQHICIDTKKDCLELFQNLTQSHVRFRNELIRAKDHGIQLYILTEERLPPGGLANWESPVYKSNSVKHKKGEPMTVANPATMKKVMLTMQEKYGVKFRFCDKSDTGKVILGLLGIDENSLGRVNRE